MAQTKPNKFDFSGYATKANVKCSDGRTIRPAAFKHNDGAKVPLVWQHMHNEPDNILGHAILEDRPDGVYAYGSFNNTPSGQNAKSLVEHGDIVAMSIFANQLKETDLIVHQGRIREVSLVITGANPGALIENISFAHGDDGDIETSTDEAIITSGQPIELKHEDKQPDEENSDDEITVGEVLDSMTEIQKKVVYALVAEATGTSESKDMKQSDIDTTQQGEKETMKSNVFDKSSEKKENTLSHDQLSAIMETAKKSGSLKDAFLAHAVTYGIENIDYLFPDARTVATTPTFVERDRSWVSKFMGAAKHSPFSRIKSMIADITGDDARAKGYIKGALKKEEFFALAKRVTTPTTVYKKQKLDRDDIIDIVDFDVVAWLKTEMRGMLDEEIARAGLISDGRAAEHADKINEANIRPIYKDAELYAPRYVLAANDDVHDIIEKIITARKDFRGTGTPSFFTTADVLTMMLLAKDTTNRRLYKSVQELASELRVSDIIEVPAMEGISRTIVDPASTVNLLGIVVNPIDYVYGADKGGNVSMFDDFDIDYNQQKYLIEARCSGALVNPKTALIIEQTAA